MILAEHLGRMHDDAIFRQIADGVKEAAWPWRFHRIVGFVEYDIVDGGNYLVLEGLLGDAQDWVYYHRQPIPPVPEANLLIEIVIHGFTTRFRSWRQEPESNIDLGEN